MSVRGIRQKKKENDLYDTDRAEGLGREAEARLWDRRATGRGGAAPGKSERADPRRKCTPYHYQAGREYDPGDSTDRWGGRHTSCSSSRRSWRSWRTGGALLY